MLLATPANAEAAQCAGSPGTTRSRLDVLVTEFRAPRDDAVVTLDGDDPSRLLKKGGKLLRARLPARARIVQACFWVAPGQYSIATYHDEKGNHNSTGRSSRSRRVSPSPIMPRGRSSFRAFHASASPFPRPGRRSALRPAIPARMSTCCSNRLPTAITRGALKHLGTSSSCRESLKSMTAACDALAPLTAFSR